LLALDFQSRADVVGHGLTSPAQPSSGFVELSVACERAEVDAFPSMRRTDAASRQNGRPNGVAESFQVSENKVEPRPAVRSRNLLPNDD
jgi:hypothetical protein